MPRRRDLRSEEGTVLIYVAFALFALFAFNIFVFDYGVLWVSRRAAQNAADASAHAAAVALAFDGNDLTDDGPAKQSALGIAAQNFVWGEPSDAPAMTAADITFPPCPFPNEADQCVRVEVHREAARGNALPVLFGPFAGIASQNIRATATAEIFAGNASNCLKPWAVIDRWAEHWPAPPAAWSTNSKFDKYKQNGDPDPKITDPDVYTPPTSSDPGTGFAPFDADRQLTADYGLQLVLKSSQANQFNAGWFEALSLGCNGADCYRDNIKGCAAGTYEIGETLTYDVDTEQGNKVGPTNQAVYTDPDSLCLQDPGAHWDTSLNNGRGGIAGSAFPISPRIVAVPLISPEDATTTKNGKTTVTIQNIMGFFVECPANPPSGAVIGRLTTAPGLVVGNGSPLGPESQFLLTIALVR